MAAARGPAGAGLICAAVVAGAAIGRGHALPGVVVAAVAGLVLVALAAWRRYGWALWVGLAALAAADVGGVIAVDSALDGTVALDGAVLFLAAELVATRLDGTTGPATTGRWLGVRAILAAAGACAGLLAVAVAGLAPATSLGLIALAAAVPVAILAAALRYASRV